MEKMYISIAQGESLEEQSHKDLKAKVAEQSDNPDIMNVGFKCRKESVHVVKPHFGSVLETPEVVSAHFGATQAKLLTCLTRKDLRIFTDNFRRLDSDCSFLKRHRMKPW